jgi:predicted dehydrogenase
MASSRTIGTPKTVLLVGLGNIGMGYDLEITDQSKILTHARAFNIHSEFELVAAVDSDKAKNKIFEKHYKKPAYLDLNQALKGLKPDIVVVAAPTKHHLTIIQQIFSHYKPQAILCEKPLSYALEEASEIVNICDNAGVKLFVIYMRRSDPGFNSIATRIKEGDIKGPFIANVCYSKGLYNSASHFINLFNLYFGQSISHHVLSTGVAWGNIDPQPDFCICYEDAKAYFLALDANQYFYNKFEIYCSSGHIHYNTLEHALTWQQSVENVLTANTVQIKNSLNNIQLMVVDELNKALNGMAAQISCGTDALQTIETCAAIGGGKWNY